MNDKKRLSKKDILNEIKKLNESNQDLSARHNLLKNSRLFNKARNLFGTWQNAIESAGIDYSKILKQKQWTKENVLKEIDELYKQSVYLSDTNIRKISPKLVYASQRYFGSWKNAVNSLNLDYNKLIYKKPGQFNYVTGREQIWTKERIINKIKEIYDSGKDLSPTAIKTKEYGGLYVAARREFGSWENALKNINIEYDKISRLPSRTFSGQKKIREILNKKRLEELYVNKGLSTVDIGKEYKISATLVTSLLRKNNITLKETIYGYKEKIICEDGHLVKSNIERQVCDWLSRNNISHRYEEKLYYTKKYLKGIKNKKFDDPRIELEQRKFKSDFTVGNYVLTKKFSDRITSYYIEILGLKGKESYDNRYKDKKKVYEFLERNFSVKLVEIHPKDDLDKKLGFLIPLFGK